MYDEDDDLYYDDDYYDEGYYYYPCQCSYCVGFRAGYRAALQDTEGLE